MKQTMYEKPKMKKVILRNSKAVAGVCWSEAANTPGKKWFYDYNGSERGYLEFELIGNCSGNDGSIISVEYMPEDVGETDAAVTALKKLNDELKEVIKFEFGDYGITDDPSQVS